MVAFLVGLSVSGIGKRMCSRVNSNGMCDICNNNINYVNDGNGNCLAHFADKCKFVDEFGRCTTCSSGLKSNGFCLQSAAITGCVEYNIDGTCAACSNTYYLASPTSCVLVTVTVVNCAVYEGDGICKSCSVGTILRNNQCVASISGCLVQSSVACSSCINGGFVDIPLVKTTAFDRSFWPIITQKLDLPSLSLHLREVQLQHRP